MLRLFNDIKSVSKRKPKKIRYLYESNFAGSLDNWEEVSGVFSLGHSQSFGGESNVLQIRAEAGVGKATLTSIKNLSALSSGDIVIGNDYEISFRYAINSANDEIIYVDNVQLGGASHTIDTGAVSTDTWLSRSVTFTASSTGYQPFIRLNEDHESGVTDLVYFKDIKIRQV